MSGVGVGDCEADAAPESVPVLDANDVRLGDAEVTSDCEPSIDRELVADV